MNKVQGGQGIPLGGDGPCEVGLKRERGERHLAGPFRAAL